MSSNPKVSQYQSLPNLAKKLRSDMEGNHCILLFAYNRTGKTRLSMEFKEHGKRKKQSSADTLYFNAFTEDLSSVEISATPTRAKASQAYAGVP